MNSTLNGPVPNNAIGRLRASVADALRPPDRISVSEWTDRFRMLSTKSAREAGRYRTSRTPYVREIQDCLSWTSPVREVVFMKASQVGGTEIGLNFVGYTIAQNPGPMMFVSPTLDLAKRLSRQRVDPMIEATPVLSERVQNSKSRDSANSMFSKEFPGGMLLLCGANSAASLRQAPIRCLVLDEVDEYPPDVEGQGDPIELAKARTRTFEGSEKVLMASSPTMEGNSRIARAFERTDKCYFFVPCPSCNHFQRLVWANIKWERREDGSAIPETARYSCEKCQSLIPNHAKTWMLERGEWRATHPERSGISRGFHISALYSPPGWFSWEQAVALWDRAQSNTDELKTFVNTVLGECWVEQGDAPDWQKLYNRRENYRLGSVPRGVGAITAGVDVQGDRIEVEIVGWGRNLESWSIDYIVILGQPSQAKTWKDLERALDRPLLSSEPPFLQHHIALTAIDAGFQTQDVYSWVRSRPASSTIAVKGVESFPLLVGQPNRVDVQTSGRTIRAGVKSWPVGTNVAKRQLYGWLRMPQPTEPEKTGFPPGWCHFPMYAQENFEQLCAEKSVPRKNKRGFIVWQWEKIRARNEHLDCRVYARAASAVLGLDRYTPADWDEVFAATGGGSRQRPAQQHRQTDEADDFWRGR